MKKYSITLIVFAIMACVNYINRQHYAGTVNLRKNRSAPGLYRGGVLKKAPGTKYTALAN